MAAKPCHSLFLQDMGICLALIQRLSMRRATALSDRAPALNNVKKAASNALQHTTLGIKKKDRPGSAFLLHLSPQTQRLFSRRATAPIRQSTGSLHPPTFSYSLLWRSTASEHTQGNHPNVSALLSLPNWKGSCSSEMVVIRAQARNAV